jgi:hypothetical protein
VQTCRVLCRALSDSQIAQWQAGTLGIVGNEGGWSRAGISCYPRPARFHEGRRRMAMRFEEAFQWYYGCSTYENPDAPEGMASAFGLDEPETVFAFWNKARNRAGHPVFGRFLPVTPVLAGGVADCIETPSDFSDDLFCHCGDGGTAWDYLVALLLGVSFASKVAAFSGALSHFWIREERQPMPCGLGLGLLLLVRYSGRWLVRHEGFDELQLLRYLVVVAAPISPGLQGREDQDHLEQARELLERVVAQAPVSSGPKHAVVANTLQKLELGIAKLQEERAQELLQKATVEERSRVEQALCSGFPGIDTSVGFSALHSSEILWDRSSGETPVDIHSGIIGYARFVEESLASVWEEVFSHNESKLRSREGRFWQALVDVADAERRYWGKIMAPVSRAGPEMGSRLLREHFVSVGRRRRKATGRQMAELLRNLVKSLSDPAVLGAEIHALVEKSNFTHFAGLFNLRNASAHSAAYDEGEGLQEDFGRARGHCMALIPLLRACTAV